MSQLRQRVVTAVPLLVALVLLLFLAPYWLLYGLSAAIFIAAAWEWAVFLRLSQPSVRLVYAVATAVLLAVEAWLVPSVIDLHVVLWIAMGWWACAFLWVLRYPTPVPRTVAILAGWLVLAPCWAAVVALLASPGRGPVLLLLVLAVVFAADIGAYFAGRRFGRIKLAPQVSPGKTWEGFVGGVLLAALVAAAGGPMAGLPVAFILPVGASIAVISVVGDLTESMFKRSAGVKDSGSLFPGHGGILDRLDSITAAVPLYVLALSWYGVVPA